MWNGHAWMVMEYCDGGALSTLLKDVVLTEQEIAYIVRQITEGLHYLHNQKRVHRDIKADNILLNLNGEVKLGTSDKIIFPHAYWHVLADLGLVEELEEEPTTTSSTNDAIEDNRRDLTKQHNLGMAGSCYWMAPVSFAAQNSNYFSYAFLGNYQTPTVRQQSWHMESWLRIIWTHRSRAAVSWSWSAHGKLEQR